MDGGIILHARSGLVIWNRMYTEEYGLDLAQFAADPDAKKDSNMQTMMLANYISALFTNVTQLLQDSLSTLPLASRASLLHDSLAHPLSSLDTGATQLFFAHDVSLDSCLPSEEEQQVASQQQSSSTSASASASASLHTHSDFLCCVFLKRGISSEVGQTFAQSILHTFLNTFAAEMKLNKFPYKPGMLRYFKNVFNKVVEEQIFHQLTNLMLETILESIQTRCATPWIYGLMSETFNQSHTQTSLTHITQTKEENIVPAPPTTTTNATSSHTPSSSDLLHTLFPFHPKTKKWWRKAEQVEFTPLEALGKCYIQIVYSAAHIDKQKDQHSSSAPSPPPPPATSNSGKVGDISAATAASAQSIHPLSLTTIQYLLTMMEKASKLMALKELGDRVCSLEVTLPVSLTAFSASSSSSTDRSLPSQKGMKLWMLRVDDLLLIIPTQQSSVVGVNETQPQTAQSSSTQPTPVTFHQLTTYLSPQLTILETHLQVVYHFQKKREREREKAAQEAAEAKQEELKKKK